MNGLAPRRSAARVWLGSGALVAYVAIVLFATLWPTPLDQGYAASIQRFLDVLHRNGIPVWFGYNKLEFLANVLMFLPLGFLVTMLLQTRFWWLALLICPALSIAIELTQAVALSARFATVTDVMSNSLGALIGIAVAVSLRALIYHRDQKLIAHELWLRGVPA